MRARFLSPVVALLVVVAAVVAVTAGCLGGGEGADGGATALFVTPAATPTPVGTPTPTPTPVPPPELILSATNVYQAGTVLVSLTGDVASGTATFLGRRYELIQGERSRFTYVPVGILDGPGSYPITVEFATASGSTATATGEVTVLETQWTVDELTFTGEQQQLLDPAVVAQEDETLEQMYSTYTPEKLWEGPWQLPTDGFVSGYFGEQRSIDGGPPSGHHGGTDFGADEGAPVAAPNNGRVVMAQEMAVRGNMVIIDHGGGVLSGYAHLSSFNVAVGQEVAKGDPIGAVGNTGLSTGPHLHWEMSVHGFLVDALRWTDGTNGF